MGAFSVLLWAILFLTLEIKNTLMKMHISIVMFCALSPTICKASWDVFDCKVLSVNELLPTGTLISDIKLQRELIDSTFSVERKSGEIRRNYFINNRASKSIRVINESETFSYYVISEGHEPYVMVSYLYIANEREGLQKSFTYTLSGQYVYSGVCQ